MHARVLLPLMLCACVSAPPAPTPEVDDKVLSLFMFPAAIPMDVLARFEKEAGVKVTLSTYETNEELIDTLASRSDAYDVIMPSDDAVEILIRRKQIRALDRKLLPHYTNLDPGFLTPYFGPDPVVRHSIPFAWGTTGIAYDRTLVSPPPTAWKDLWRPDLAGKLVLLDDSREMLGIALRVMGKDPNTRPDGGTQGVRALRAGVGGGQGGEAAMRSMPRGRRPS
ncbi:MAG: ABC transporter substrate-binding protein [Myxococcota bacterium]